MRLLLAIGLSWVSLTAWADLRLTQIQSASQASNVFHDSVTPLSWPTITGKKWKVVFSQTLENAPPNDEAVFYNQIEFKLQNQVTAVQWTGQKMKTFGPSEMLWDDEQISTPVSVGVDSVQFFYAFNRVTARTSVPAQYSGEYYYECKLLSSDQLLCAVKVRFQILDSRYAKYGEFNDQIVRYDGFVVQRR